MKTSHSHRKILRPTRDGRSGGVLIFCLLVVVIGAFVLAAWAQMLAGRIHSVEAAKVAHARRVALANARSLAQQHILHSLTNGTVPNSSANLANYWGGFSLSYINLPTNTLTSDKPVELLNPFSPFGAGGYVATPDPAQDGLEVTLMGGRSDPETTETNEVTRRFYIRSRSPLLGGFPLALHTNAAATNFQNIVVATNSAGGSALVFAAPPSIANAPSATTYVSTAARFVRQAPDSTANAPQLPIGLPAITSGASGYGGQLDAPLARSQPITDMSTEVAGELPTTPLVTDVMKADGTSEYRVVGSNSTLVDRLQVVDLPNVDTSHGPSSMLALGPPPDSPPTQTGPNEIEYHYFGQNFEIKYASHNVQYWKDPSWETVNADNEILTFGSNGSIAVASLDTTQELEYNTANATRVVLFSPPANTLMVFTAEAIHFKPVSTSLSNGVLVYRKGEYFQPNGVAFLAIPEIPMGGLAWSVGDEKILARFSPSIMTNNYRCQFPDYNLRIYELDVNQTYTISDTNNVPIIAIHPNQGNATASRQNTFEIEAGAESDMPLLHYLERTPVTVAGSGETTYWSKWLTVLSANMTLDPTSASSALLFAFLDDDTGNNGEPLALDLEDGDNERQTGLVIYQAGNATLQAPPGRTWNLSATFLDTPVTLNAGASFNIVGGIRANRDVLSPTNAVTLSPNTAPAALEPFLDRVGWLESWQQ